MVALSSYTAGFDSGALDAGWTQTASATAPTITYEGGRRLVSVPATTTTNVRIVSDVGSIIGDAIYARFHHGFARQTNQAEHYLAVDNTGASVNQLRWNVSGGNIIANYIIGGTSTGIGTNTAYDPFVHAWFRIKEAGGTISWQYADANASNPPLESEWVTHGTVATTTITWDLTTARIRQHSGTFGNTSPVGSISSCDSINTAATALPADYAAPIYAGSGTASSDTADLALTVPAVADKAGQMLVAHIDLRFSAATITPPAGWTLAGEASGSAGADGVDAGSAKAQVYIKETTAAESANIYTFASANNNISVGVISVFDKPTGSTWETAVATASENTPAATWDTTLTALDIRDHDLVISTIGYNGDVATASTHTQVLTQTGVIFGCGNEIVDFGTAGGSDARVIASLHAASSGSGTGQPVYKHTNTGNSANTPAGGQVLLRLRAVRATAIDSTVSSGQSQGADAAGSTSVDATVSGSQAQSASAAGANSINATVSTGQAQTASAAGSISVAATATTGQAQSTAAQGQAAWVATVATGQSQTTAAAGNVVTPTAHPYWRILMTRKNAYIGLREVEMRATAGGADQCTGGTATAFDTFGSDVAANAFDNSATTQWYSASGTVGTQSWLQYQFTAPVEVNQISLSTPDVQYSPGAFSLQWSDDGTTFTTAESWVIDAYWNVDQQYLYTVGQAKEYWRLLIASSAGGSAYAAMAELSLRTAAGVAASYVGGTASANAVFGNNLPHKAFDAANATVWESNNEAYPKWLRYRFPLSTEIVEYAITPYGAYLGEAPKDFDLQYSPDGTTWTTVDSRTGQIGWTVDEVRVFTIAGAPSAINATVATAQAQNAASSGSVGINATASTGQAQTTAAAQEQAATVSTGQTQSTAASGSVSVAATVATGQAQSASAQGSVSVNATASTGQSQSTAVAAQIASGSTISTSAAQSTSASANVSTDATVTTSQSQSVDAAQSQSATVATNQAQTSSASGSVSVNATVASGQAQSTAAQGSVAWVATVTTGQAQTSSATGSVSSVAAITTQQAQTSAAAGSTSVVATASTGQSQSLSVAGLTRSDAAVSAGQAQTTAAQGSVSVNTTTSSSQTQSTAAQAGVGVTATVSTGQAQSTASQTGISANATATTGQSQTTQGSSSPDATVATGQGQSVSASGAVSVSASVATGQGQSTAVSGVVSVSGTVATAQAQTSAAATGQNATAAAGQSQSASASGAVSITATVSTAQSQRVEASEPIRVTAATGQSQGVASQGSVGVTGTVSTGQSQNATAAGSTDIVASVSSGQSQSTQAVAVLSLDAIIGTAQAQQTRALVSTLFSNATVATGQSQTSTGSGAVSSVTTVATGQTQGVVAAGATSSNAAVASQQAQGVAVTGSVGVSAVAATAQSQMTLAAAATIFVGGQVEGMCRVTPAVGGEVRIFEAAQFKGLCRIYPAVGGGVEVEPAVVASYRFKPAVQGIPNVRIK